MSKAWGGRGEDRRGESHTGGTTVTGEACLRRGAGLVSESLSYVELASLHSRRKAATAQTKGAKLGASFVVTSYKNIGVMSDYRTG